jgi:hypothetical protein
LERGLERGLAEPDDSGEITEFLIAPHQSKGTDRSGTKAWVDQIYRKRESQEDRRILYVAATRARDELHLFARPAWKVEKDGSIALVEPSKGLLKTAWQAFEEEIRTRFSEWTADREAASTETVDIAASSDSNLLVMPDPARPTLLRRLPPDYRSPQGEQIAAPATVSDLRASRLYDRHEGGLLSRALGNAVHALLEELARLRETCDWPLACAALRHFEPRIAAQVRGLGVEQAQAASLAAEALKLALAASNDPNGQWILSPHVDAASEMRWAGVVGGAISNVRVDRIFRGGLTPQSEGGQGSGDQAWWIIDYKTAHADAPDPAAALPGLRNLFAPQLEAYAKILSNLHGADAVLRAGLYYPRMLLLDWWEL